MVLKVTEITKSFAVHYRDNKGSAEKEITNVLNGVNLSLKRGMVAALIGENGSGKSTLFNIINGLLRPDNGKVEYYSKVGVFHLTEMPAHKLARLGIARLFQGSQIFGGLTVLENMCVADNDESGESPWHIITMPNRVKKKEEERKKKAEQILNTLLGNYNALWAKRNQPAAELSIGQQRLLAFARLFMNETAVLYLLDEPCAGVSPDIRQLIVSMILDIKKQGKTVLLVEHDPELVKHVADTRFYMQQGKIIPVSEENLFV